MFLETITAFGNNVLVPINRIKFVYITYKTSWELIIQGDDADWIECFEKEATEELNKRYEEIKKILKAK